MMSPFIKDAQQWYETPAGHWIHDQEKQCLDSLWEHCFGYYLLQLSFSAQVNTLSESSRIRHRIDLTPHPALHTPAYIPTSTLVGDFNLIPLASESIDAALVHHWLGLYGNPMESLGEIYRVLMPEGKIIICGIRPAWLWKLGDKLTGHSYFPWSKRSPTPSQIKRWLTAAGFMVSKTVWHHSQGLSFYRVGNDAPSPGSVVYKGIKQLSRMGCGASGYIIVGHKRVSTLTPMRMNWNRGRIAWSDYAKPLINK